MSVQRHGSKEASRQYCPFVLPTITSICTYNVGGIMGATRFRMGFKPIGGAHSQNAGADSAKASSYRPLILGMPTTPRALPNTLYIVA